MLFKFIALFSRKSSRIHLINKRVNSTQMRKLNNKEGKK